MEQQTITIRKCLDQITTVLILLLFINFLLGCESRSTLPDNVATENHPAQSSSGEYELHVISSDDTNPHLLGFEVRDGSRVVVYRESEQFHSRHQTYFLWDDVEDRVWVYSGDLGTFFWEQRPGEQTWNRYTYVEENVPAPKFLKESYPDRYRQ